MGIIYKPGTFPFHILQIYFIKIYKNGIHIYVSFFPTLVLKLLGFFSISSRYIIKYGLLIFFYHVLYNESFIMF